MITDIIRTENISKHYKDVYAVSNMSLNVRKGEIYGFLGLNGAGKTTTIRMLLGMIRPTSGTAYINEKMISSDNTELWRHVGSLVSVHKVPILLITARFFEAQGDFSHQKTTIKFYRGKSC